jgi:hypothetical protein
VAGGSAWWARSCTADCASTGAGWIRRADGVSLIDIAWVLVARDDVVRHGGVLDEARVNRVRYLDGTPKEATRWIDRGWALRVVVRSGEGAAGPRWTDGRID